MGNTGENINNVHETRAILRSNYVIFSMHTYHYSVRSLIYCLRLIYVRYTVS